MGGLERPNIKIKKPSRLEVRTRNCFLKHRISRIITNNKILKSEGATNKQLCLVVYPAKFLSMEVKANFGKFPEKLKPPKFRVPGLEGHYAPF